MNILCLSGFNPLNLQSWKICRYYKDSQTCCPDKRNWTASDMQFVMDYYTGQYESEPYVITAHSDGGTIAHRLAAVDGRCIGLHVHSGLFRRPIVARKIPVLLTSCHRDITGMGMQTAKAYRFYVSSGVSVVNKVLPRVSWHGHDYQPSIPVFREWLEEAVRL